MPDGLYMNAKIKVINWVLFVILLLFALVQLNDPDPVIWFATYFIVALFAVLSNYLRIPKLYYYLAIAGLVLFSFFHISFFTDWVTTGTKEELFGNMLDKKPYIEGAREFLGLVLALVAMIYILRHRLQYKGSKI